MNQIKNIDVLYKVFAVFVVLTFIVFAASYEGINEPEMLLRGKVIGYHQSLREPKFYFEVKLESGEIVMAPAVGTISNSYRGVVEVAMGKGAITTITQYRIVGAVK